MSVEHFDIRTDGELVGHAISLGARFIFYAARDDLRGLDGRRFDTLDAVRRAVTAELKIAA